MGLHDEGDHARKPELADHVNVWLIKGVSRQWKQPLCYTFSNGPTKSRSIKTMLTRIIQKCHEVGLTIVATVCDQGSPNQAAINLLLEETRNECLRQNTENIYFG